MSLSTHEILKIAVVGPESTGKSTMAKYLAAHFNCLYVPEYSRYYCKDLNREYTLEDEINMFHGQLALEDALIDQTSQNILICDTTIMTVKIWCDHLFQHTPILVIDEIHARKYDLYLLMDIDLPWEDDPLRDFPQQRAHFLHVWKQELTSIGANYIEISGLGEERLSNGLRQTQSFLRQKQS